MIKNLLPSRHPVLSRLSTLHIRLHPSLKERVVLSEAINMKSNAALPFVFHAEVEPLAMAIGIRVDSHVKIILEICNPDIDIYTSMARLRFPLSNWLLN
jgi:hypothetical protein